MKSFLYAWVQQNYALMLADKHGLSSCLQKRTFGHRLFTAFSFYENHVNTTETLGKGHKHYAKGLLIKTLSIFLFIGTSVKPNQEN